MRIDWDKSVVRALISLLILGSLTACSHEPEEHAQAPAQVKGDAIVFTGAHVPASLSTAPVSVSQGASLRISGRLAWNEDQTVRVFSPYSGHVERILVKLGDEVHRGQPLAEVDSSEYADAQSDYRKAVAAKTLAQSALSRAHDLHEHGVIALKDLEQAQADSADAAAEAERTEHLLTMFGSSGSSIRQRMVLRSPINGVVVERAINPGEELRGDTSAAAQFVITDSSSLWVLLDAHESDIVALQPGAAFEFRIGSYANDSFEGKILRVADFVDPASRTIKILGLVRNPAHRLKGEMFVTATVPAAASTEPQAPATAVYLLGDRHYAFVRDGSSFVRREVQVGPEREGQIEIAAGLRPGEMVVTQGVLFLQQMLQSGASG